MSTRQRLHGSHPGRHFIRDGISGKSKLTKVFEIWYLHIVIITVWDQIQTTVLTQLRWSGGG